MDRELPCSVTICQSIMDGIHMDNMLFSTAEMGVTDIIPIFSDRVYGYAREMWQGETVSPRWRDAAKAFTQNSLREVAPIVHTPITFAEAIEKSKGYDVAVLCYENEHDPFCTAKALAECKEAKSIVVFIGCEDGFAPEEVELAKENGVKIITLGKRIIRAVNAGAIFMGMLTYVLELHGDNGLHT